MLTNQRVEKIQCHQIHSILSKPPSVPLEGKLIPDFQTKLNLKNLKFIQTDLVYLYGLPTELCDFTALSSMVYLGQYGELKEVQSARESSDSQNSSIYVRFEDSFQAALAILALSLYAKEHHLPRALFGTSKYCPSYLNGRSCSSRVCHLVHRKVVKGHYFYQQKKDTVAYNFEIICSILRENKKKMRKIFKAIKTGKRMKNAVFPTVEETIEYYGVERVLEEYWGCEEFIEELDSRLKEERHMDEYDELWKDVCKFEYPEAQEQEELPYFETPWPYNRRLAGVEIGYSVLGLKGNGFFHLIEDFEAVFKLSKKYLKKGGKSSRAKSRLFYAYKEVKGKEECKEEGKEEESKPVEGSKRKNSKQEPNLIDVLAQPPEALRKDSHSKIRKNSTILKNQQKLEPKNELLKDLGFPLISKKEEQEAAKEEPKEEKEEKMAPKEKETNNDIHEISTRSNGISNSNYIRSSTVTSVKKIEVRFDENVSIFSSKAQIKKRKKLKKKRRKKKQKTAREEENQRLYKTEEALSDMKREEVFSEDHKSIGGGSSPHECDPLEDRNSLKSLINDKKESQPQSASTEKLKNKSKKGLSQSEKYKKNNEILRKVEDVQTAPFFNEEKKGKKVEKKEKKKKTKDKPVEDNEGIMEMSQEGPMEEEEERLTEEIIDFYKDLNVKQVDDFELWQRVQYFLIDDRKPKSIRKKKRKKIRQLIKKEKKRRIEALEMQEDELVSPNHILEEIRTHGETYEDKLSTGKKRKKSKKVKFKKYLNKENEVTENSSFDIIYDQWDEASSNLPIDLIYNRATKKIMASEYELEKYRELRSFAKQLYRVTKEQKTGYGIVCQMLRNLPGELKKPMFYEKSEEATKFIFPVENITLMPDEKDYPF